MVTATIESPEPKPISFEPKTTQRVPQTDVIPMNLQHSNQTVTLQDWNSAEYTDVFDDAATNISERGELAQSIAKATTRREDQMLIDALEAASTSLLVASSIGGANTNLNIAKLRRCGELLGDEGVCEDDEITFVGSYSGRSALLGTTEVTSVDFNSVRALVNGEVHTFLGLNFKWISRRTEGGLDLTSGDRTCFAYAKSALGLGVSIDQRMEINYIPTKTSWLANMLFKANAIDIDDRGIIEVTCDENG